MQLTPALPRRVRYTERRAVVATGTAAAGCALLAARPLLTSLTGHPAALLLSLYAALALVGRLVSLPRGEIRPVRLLPQAGVVTVGIVVCAAGRLRVRGAAPGVATATFVLANVLAAVAEELWFRRLCYGLLAPAGVAFAVAGSSILFALIHVPTYGWAIVPLDIAAGCVFAWQRVASGSWHASAATHAVANVLVVI